METRRAKRGTQTITVRPSVWREVSGRMDKKKGTLADANFVTVCEAALRLEGPVYDVAPNVKHGWKE